MEDEHTTTRMVVVVPKSLLSTWLEGMRCGRNEETQVRFLIGANYGDGFKKIPSLVKSGFGGFLGPKKVPSS
jgi:hypothetical protein